MAPRSISAFFLSVAIGYGLGFIPGLNRHLHWNIWFIVPISGLFLGFGFGWIQFWVHSLLRLEITKATTAAIVAGSCAGYVATEYGTYRSSSVLVVDAQGAPPQERRLDEVISFGTYMRERLGSSTVSVGERAAFEYGIVGTTASFVVDMLGAGLGTIAALAMLGFMHPLCGRCSRLKKKVRGYGILPPSRKEVLQELFQQIAALCSAGQHALLVQKLHALAKGEQNKKASLRLAVRELACPSCGEATVLIRVYKKDDRGHWTEDNDVRFSSTEAPAIPSAQEA